MNFIWQKLNQSWRSFLNWLNSFTDGHRDSSTDTYRDSNGVYQAISGKVSRWQKLKNWFLKFIALLILIIVICLVIKVIFSVILIALTILVLLLVFLTLRRRL